MRPAIIVERCWGDAASSSDLHAFALRDGNGMLVAGRLESKPNRLIVTSADGEQVRRSIIHPALSVTPLLLDALPDLSAPV